MKELIKKFQDQSNALNAQITKLRDQAKKDSQDIIKVLFDEFFKTHGESVYAIFWTQYTPYFNDGEECYFSVNDIWLAFTEEGFEDGEGDGDMFARKSDYEAHLAKWTAYHENPQAAYDAYIVEHTKRHPNWRSTPNQSWTQPTRFESWTPTYYDEEDLIEKLEFINSNPNLAQVAEDFEALKGVINSIDDDYMELIYGNHVKVVYYGPDGKLDIDEYSHD